MVRHYKFWGLMGALALVLTGCGPGQSAAVQKKLEPVTLQWWGVVEDETAMATLVNRYQTRLPQVRIVYTRIPYDQYETRLLESWATRTGPDIFAVPNAWIGKYRDKLVAMPATVSLVRKVSGEGFGSKDKIQTLNERLPGVVGVRNNFVDQVTRDAVVAGPDGTPAVFGLPLSFDVLALYYNRDLLNRAGVTAPPATWEEFIATVRKLTTYDNKGDVATAGVAMGRADNVDRAIDILSLLMLQNGTVMQDERGAVKFHERLPNGYEPGLRALTFYTDFANPAKEVYSWSEKFSGSMTALTEGKAAMAFGYAWHVPQIRARAPQLQIAVAQVPQLPPNPAVNFANYWLQGVSFQSAHPDIAWDVLQTLTRREHVESYLSTTHRPTALRALIDVQSQDAELAPFVGSLLTAQSWYHGKNPLVAEAAFRTMIETANKGESKLEEVLNFAAAQVARSL